ncbi:MAG TPA: YciI family protein [Jatrophihabitans sp.]|jgi:hypothetical protein|nr:YciI family protein [Jatrophihabitans sp.]
MGGYVVLLYQDEKRLAEYSDAQRADLLEQHGAFQAKHGDAIKLGDALQATETARSVQVGDGSMAITDGPFVETKEALGGFYVIEAGDLDEAIAIAADVPAPHGGVEIRPVMVYS